MTLKTIIKRSLRIIYEQFAAWLLKPMLIYEHHHPQREAINERPIEYAFAFKCLREISPQQVLDVGSGRSSWPHILANCGFKVTAIDQIKYYWKGGFFNRHYHIIHIRLLFIKITVYV